MNNADVVRNVGSNLDWLEAECGKKPEEINRLRIELSVQSIRLLLRELAPFAGWCQDNGMSLNLQRDADGIAIRTGGAE